MSEKITVEGLAAELAEIKDLLKSSLSAVEAAPKFVTRPPLRGVQTTIVGQEATTQGATLERATEAYSASAKTGVSAAHLRNIKATLNVFSKPYRKRPVQQISKRMVVAYRDGLVKVGVSVKTVNNNLGHIQCCFEYCIKHDLFEGSNPAKGLRLRCKDAAKNQRKAFSDVQVGEVFSGLLAGGREKVARGLLPTFLLYTGARAEELAQLRVGDVKQLQSNGAPADVGDPEAIWCFDLTDPDQRHKNEASKRLIPVHPDLWQLGLTRLLNRPASAPLFAELNAGASGRLSEAPSRWFCDRWLRDRCQIRDKRLVTHSLRHTVATKLKHNGCSDTIVAQILGHTLSGMGSRYAKDWELNKLNEAILTLGWDL